MNQKETVFFPERSIRHNLPTSRASQDERSTLGADGIFRRPASLNCEESSPFQRKALQNKILTTSELERKLGYRHVPLIQFETLADEQEVCLKGLEQEKKGEVSAQALELGKQYYPLILNSYLPQTSVRWVHEAVGYGLFAEETIEKGAYVGEYTGTVRKNDRRYFEPLNNYCYEYPVQDEIGRNYVIDASQGCLTRFINHSFHPNLQPCYAYWQGYYHLIFLSLCRIEVGHQFSYDYGENYWYLRQKPHDL